jgi:hypothetical protein
MSYNSAYREDTQNTMSNVILEYTRNVANEIRETFLSGPTPPPPPVVDPNLLFDANFNDSSLAVDYSKDDSALLVFESNNMNNIVPGDGFVSSTGHSTHIKLTSGLPAYLKHTGDQSWVVNFRINAPLSTTRFIIHTAPVGPDRATTFEIRTGMFMFLYNNNFQATLFKGPADTLVGSSATIGSVDLDLHINSAVFTYERLNHKLSLYFNGVFLSSILAPAGFIDDVVDWSTADNMYVNQSNRFSIANLTHYHKISVYDKILTPEEIEDIYNASPPVVSINKKLIVLPADFASVDVVLVPVLI